MTDLYIKELREDAIKMAKQFYKNCGISVIRLRKKLQFFLGLDAYIEFSKELKSLIKVSLNHDMNLFKINTRKQTTFSKYVLPLILALYLMILIGIYAVKMIKLLEPIHLEYVTLSFFAI